VTPDTALADPRIRRVEECIVDFFQRQRSLPGREGLAELWEAAERLSSGGKYLRPRLFLAAYEALAGDQLHRIDEDQLLAIATALELLHISFLLHDDVIDRDLLRRGEPNVIATAATLASQRGAGAEDARHFGAAAAILVGNAALSEVHRTFARLDLPRQWQDRLTDLLDRSIAESITGELNDVALSLGIQDHDLALVRDTTRRKTAPYSIELPLRSAAVLADAPTEIDQYVGPIAQSIGLAFQLQDDLLGVFAEPEQHGKARCADLGERKETLLIAYARRTPSWPSIEAMLGLPTYDQSAAAIARGFLAESGAVHEVEAEIARYLLDAELGVAALAEQGPGGSALADVLRVFITRLQGRTS